ncbi:MAG: hypothetical protein AABX77_03190 [Nanoarchaeota archaeon]
MKKAINLYKPVGITPLEAINRFREINKNYSGKKMSYAGRLDPMAEGVLLVLLDKETKKIGEYLGFDKEYRAEILIGISSDSNDVLGIAEIDKVAKTNKKELTGNKINKEFNQLSWNKQITEDNKNNRLLDINNEDKEELIKKLKKKIKSLKGIYDQKIPDYSSYKIKGKPMFYYARKGELVNEVKNKVYIKGIKINYVYRINSRKLLKYILNKINKVTGDFRQEIIKDKWKELLEKSDEKFLVVDVTISCSSGTYIRAIADDIGKEFGGGLLLSLKRTRVGKFDVTKSLRI